MSDDFNVDQFIREQFPNMAAAELHIKLWRNLFGQTPKLISNIEITPSLRIDRLNFSCLFGYLLTGDAYDFDHFWIEQQLVTEEEFDRVFRGMFNRYESYVDRNEQLLDRLGINFPRVPGIVAVKMYRQPTGEDPLLIAAYNNCITEAEAMSWINEAMDEMRFELFGKGFSD